MARYAPISDYGLIGDCRGSALVSRDGSIDWLCFPRYDSPSIFGALLDARDGGRFRVRPAGEFRTERRYLPHTNVLETTFHTASGAFAMRDLMPVTSEPEKRTSLTPDHQILREVEGLAGEVDVEIVYDPRPEYGRLRPVLEQRGALGLWCDFGGAACVMRSELPLQLAENRQGARGLARIHAGERRYLAFAYAEEAPAVVPPLGDVARAKVERSAKWWRDWAARCTYRGPYREAVVRSALAIKLLAYAPSGAVVAAPTTSLPEQLGGARNWDYRYCWLRDASFTLRALFALGYEDEALAFLSWMLHATRLTWPELQVLYDVFGEAKLPERELKHLEGYAGSRPVRIGNDAHGQFQLEGQLFVCTKQNGSCCCGWDEKGRMPFDPQTLWGDEWERRKIRNRVHLSFTGCLGPCAAGNSALLQLHGRSIWLKDLNGPELAPSVYDWIESMLAAGRVLTPPAGLRDHVYERFLPPSTADYEPLVDPGVVTGDGLDRLDPVCLMDVDPATARHKVEYEGRTIVFCAPACKKQFIADPTAYLVA